MRLIDIHDYEVLFTEDNRDCAITFDAEGDYPLHPASILKAKVQNGRLVVQLKSGHVLRFQNMPENVEQDLKTAGRFILAALRADQYLHDQATLSD